MDINQAFARLLTPDFEGTAFSDLKGDAGGLSRYGIAQNSHPDVDIRTITEDQAKAIYEKEYWIPGHVDELPDDIKYMHFDTCVNDGVVEAIKILQRACGADIDGVWGPETKECLHNLTLDRYADARLVVIGIIEKKHPEDMRFDKDWRGRVQKIVTQDRWEQYMAGISNGQAKTN